MDQLHSGAHSLQKWLHQPQKVFGVCLSLLLLTLFLNGTLWKLWGLYRDQAFLKEQILASKASMVSIEQQMKQAKDPTFIAREARDKMDLVSDHDLIFVFPE